jgi:Methyltransferase domain
LARGVRGKPGAIRRSRLSLPGNLRRLLLFTLFSSSSGGFVSKESGVMYFVMGDRIELIKNIPAKKIWAEVGVYRGDFSRIVLDLCDPTEYHLIDSWTYDFNDHVPFSTLTENYSEFVGRGHREAFGDDPSATQEENYQHVLSLFGADDRVRIIRKNSFDALAALKDDYFDVIYIDANHQYEFVLRDMMEARHKLKPGGIMMLNDFYEGPGGAEQNFGVLSAATTFVKRFDYYYLAMSHGSCADAAITDDPSSELVNAFLQNLMSSDLTFIGISDAIVPNIRYKLFKKPGGGVRYVALL